MTDFARLVLDADTRGLKSGERDLDSLSGKAKRTAGDVDAGASRMSGAFKKVGAAIGAFATIDFALGFAKQSSQAAIDAQEMQSAFEVVFGSMAKDVAAWAEATGNAMGRSTQEIQRGALAFQELFSKALDPTQAVELSKQFAVLTQDLASFKNLSNEVAQQKLFSGLVGEAEPLRAVGVFLSEAAVEAKALQLGIKGVSGDLTDQQKIAVRAAIIQEQLAAAQGDVLRTSGSTANQIKTLNAAVEELQVAIGSRLLPSLTPLISGLAQVVTEAATVVTGFQGLGISLGDVARTLVVAGSAWAAYRLAALASVAVNTAASGSLGIYTAAVMTATRQVGLLAGAQVAMAGATAGARTAMAGLIAGINPLGAVLAVATAGLGYYAMATARVSAENDRINSTLDQLEAKLREAGIEVGGTGEAADIAAPKIFGIGNAYAFAAQQARQLANDARLAQMAQLNADRESIRTQIASKKGGTSATDPRFQALRSFGRLLGFDNQPDIDKLEAQERRITANIQALEKLPAAAAPATAAANITAAAVSGIGTAASGSASKSKEAAKDITDGSDAILSRALPLQAELAGVTKAMDDLNKMRSKLDPSQYVQVFDALERQASALRSEIEFGAILPAEIIPQYKDWEEALGGFADKAKTSSVQIAESFRDMANRTMDAFSRLTSAIRGGGFLGILEAVIGLGFQLGSVGVFGKDIATKLNRPRIPSADGGGFTGYGSRTGGMDGRGGFLAMLHPNETVLDHTRGQGMGRQAPANVNVTVGIDPRNGNITAFVNGQIAATAGAIAEAGGQRGKQLVLKSGQRRVR